MLKAGKMIFLHAERWLNPISSLLATSFPPDFIRLDDINGKMRQLDREDFMKIRGVHCCGAYPRAFQSRTTESADFGVIQATTCSTFETLIEWQLSLEMLLIPSTGLGNSLVILLRYCLTIRIVCMLTYYASITCMNITKPK